MLVTRVSRRQPASGEGGRTRDSRRRAFPVSLAIGNGKGRTGEIMRSLNGARWAFSLAAAVIGLAAGSVTASAGEPVLGTAQPWDIGLQPAFSPVMEKVHEFHNMLLVIITGIVLIVLGLLGYIILRFNAKRNPVPSKTAHNTALEVIWTAVPIMILIVIVIPSMKLLYFANKTADPELTLKVIGHQWYWSYVYPDYDDITFDSIPIQDSDIDVSAGQVRLLSVDNPVVLPIDTNIQVLVSSDDVIHNWAVPSLALKKDATPGRINETWVRINREGTYYGMCSELCGVNHYFMPIEIRAVSKEAFAAWLEEAKEKFASRAQPRLAAAGNGTSN